MSVRPFQRSRSGTPGRARTPWASRLTRSWAALTVYLSTGFDNAGDLLARLGPHDVGKSCLYVKRLSEIDQSVLRELVDRAFQELNGRTITT